MAKKGKKGPKLQKKFLAKAKKLKEAGKTKMHVLKKAWELQMSSRGSGGKKKGKSKGGGKKRGKSKGSVFVSVKRPGRKAARVTVAAEKKKGKGKKKGAKKGKRKHHTDPAVLIARNNVKLADLRSKYDRKLSDYKSRLKKAEGSEKKRLEGQIEKLRAAHREEVARLEKKAAAAVQKAKQAEMVAVEKKRRSRKGHHKKARENPIDGWGEKFAAAAGVVTGVVITIMPYRLIRTHALVSPVGQGQWQDGPAQGQVYNPLAPAQPFWAGMFKGGGYRGLWALLTYGVVDLLLPAIGAALTSGGWKVYFQSIVLTDATLGVAKGVVDVAAVATKSTKIGNRLMAPENLSRSMRAASAEKQPAPIAVSPGQGLVGQIAGYGKAPQIGTAACCDACGQGLTCTCSGGAASGQVGGPAGTSTTGQPAGPPPDNYLPPPGNAQPQQPAQPGQPSGGGQPPQRTPQPGRTGFNPGPSRIPGGPPRGLPQPSPGRLGTQGDPTNNVTQFRRASLRG